jgi:hypothetical protein
LNSLYKIFFHHLFVVSLSNHERGFRTSERPVMPDADPASSKAVTPAQAGVQTVGCAVRTAKKVFLHPFIAAKERVPPRKGARPPQ